MTSLKKTYRFVFLGVILIISLTFTGYYFISGLPEYAVFKINKAIEHHNWKEFNKYVELDNILGESFELFAEIQSKKDAVANEGDSTKKSLFSKDFMFLIKPQAVNVMQSDLKFFIEHGTFENYSQVKMSDLNIAAYRKAFNEHSVYQSFSKENKTDSSVVFTFLFKMKASPDLAVRVQLKKVQHFWIMAGILNMRELIEALNVIKEKSV